MMITAMQTLVVAIATVLFIVVYAKLDAWQYVASNIASGIGRHNATTQQGKSEDRQPNKEVDHQSL